MKTKQARIKRIIEILNEKIPHPQIPLHHKDAYTLLIAVLLSAQCTDKRVNEVTPKLFAKAATPQKMATLSAKDIEKIVHSCGLAPTKSRAIAKLSQKLLDGYDGKVPNTLEELEKLPGVGHKTASVVLVQAFGKPAFPVDTHIHRCAKRWKLSNGKSVTQTETDLKKCFPEKDWGKIHLQIILFARTFCPARGHIKEECPICSEM